ncbi:hypothetical protein PBI_CLOVERMINNIE_36 [Gordonia phage CloverMinnie]|nr:hypothetical protein PBI_CLOVERMINNIE_36 [Gordonia phage CloverMinnie]UBF41639.1 hypothetical protein SEA_ANARQUE_36 [Gordonia phage AnarQue]WNM74929.1 hypothetical protein SEA_MOSSROSE_36 [Gordonia phage MossRose]
MAELLVGYDPSQPVGQRLAPEVIAEIEEVAPSNLDNGSVTTAKLADDAVNQDKIAPGAVGTVEIETGGVNTANLATDSVTTVKLADDSVTDEKAGLGVATAHDSAGNPITLDAVPITAAAYGSITPDPNVLYLISD